MTVPYAPTRLATPVINPSVGGFGVAFPYLSVSQYTFAPTAMDTSSLVTGPTATAQDQLQSLYDTVRRASAWADRYCFGIDDSAKGASLAATESVESAYVKVLQGELRLVCAYKPIIELTGADIGTDPFNVMPLPDAVAARVRFGRKVIYLPNATGTIAFNGFEDTIPAGWGIGRSGRFYAVWSYVNGYPHTVLAADVEAGADVVVVEPTTASGGLYGVYPGTQLTIPDGDQTESFMVESVTGSTITTASPLLYDHEVPATPDFLPVTAIPEDVTQAVIFLTTSLIKSRGDNSLVLDDIAEADKVQSSADAFTEDVANAFDLLDPFRVVTKIKS